jgi:hypothetical protein
VFKCIVSFFKKIHFIFVLDTEPDVQNKNTSCKHQKKKNKINKTFSFSNLVFFLDEEPSSDGYQEPAPVALSSNNDNASCNIF